jgi:DNA-binding transcriptional ArsR family regulator
MKVRDSILKLLAQKGDLSVKELVDLIDVSKQAIHVTLRKLLEEQKIEKFGRAPKTIYRLRESIPALLSPDTLEQTDRIFLEKEFLLITETGELLEGEPAFYKWCQQRKLPFAKTADEYIQTKKRYDLYVDDKGVINGMDKLRNTKGYDKIHLDELFYLDFYAIERFGKTRLGTLLHFAKQGQNKMLMKKMVLEIQPRINQFMQGGIYDAVGFVPPTIRREVQLMKYLDTHIKIDLPRIRIQKISGIIPVPQKSLSKLEERVRNAESSFTLNNQVSYKNLLLIDDAVGSGATLNQIAGKIKQKNIAKKVTGLAIVGSFKGFDVITDV